MFKFKNWIIKDMDIRYRCKGFTYIELALAMAIITLIVLAFAQLFIRSSISIKGMQFQTLAYNLAGDKMEDIRNNRSFGEIGGPEWHPQVWLAESDSQIQSGTTFTRNVRISALESSLKRVDIEIIWTEQGQSRNVEISSLIADKW